MSTIKSENLQFFILCQKHGKEATGFKFGQAKAKDGSVVAWDGDTLAQGVEIMIQTPEGFMPAADGTIELEDGTMIEVTGGYIANVKQPGQDPATPAADPATPANAPDANPMADMEKTAKRVIESVVKESHFAEAVKAHGFITKEEAQSLSTINDELKAKLEAQEKINTELKAQIDGLVKFMAEEKETKPAAEPTGGSASPVALSATEKEKQRADRIQEFIANERNKTK